MSDEFVFTVKGHTVRYPLDELPNCAVCFKGFQFAQEVVCVAKVYHQYNVVLVHSVYHNDCAGLIGIDANNL